VLVNDVLNANPIVNERHHAKPKAGFKFLVTELVCQATGGPQRYSGMAMPESHRHLGITPAEWEAFLADFRARDGARGAIGGRREHARRYRDGAAARAGRRKAEGEAQGGEQRGEAQGEGEEDDGAAQPVARALQRAAHAFQADGRAASW
jgi:hemoglobin